LCCQTTTVDPSPAGEPGSQSTRGPGISWISGIGGNGRLTIGATHG
jgi:hypothetical protein